MGSGDKMTTSRDWDSQKCELVLRREGGLQWFSQPMADTLQRIRTLSPLKSDMLPALREAGFSEFMLGFSMAITVMDDSKFKEDEAQAKKQKAKEGDSNEK